jgi:two-component system sensor histidine kinase TctE
MTPLRQPGLYARLAIRLLLPMMVLVSAGGALGVYVARRQTNEVFDRWLLDAAVSLAQQVRGDADGVVVDLPRSSQAMLAYDEIDRTFFSVEKGGKVLVGVAGIPHAGQHAAAYANGLAFDGSIGGLPVRVASAQAACGQCGDVTVLVAETLLKRQRTERGILWLFAPMALLLLATSAAILMTVRRTVQPLEVLAQHWNRESHESLSEIPSGDLPRELTPFATALNDLLARIRRMLARERRFAVTAAHQLRTPLAALRLGLDRARRAPDLETTRAVLAELDQSTDRTARMIQQLLLLGRLDPEHDASIELQPTNLSDVVRDVCGLFSEAAFAKDIDVEMIAPSAPVMVLAQLELLAEAIANLVDNAVKATPANGSVRVAVLRDPPRLQVSDTGAGIAADEREAAFEHFTRGAGTNWPGTGLGLAIVRDIARLHRAHVGISDAPGGRGACLTLEFKPLPGG